MNDLLTLFLLSYAPRGDERFDADPLLLTYGRQCQLPAGAPAQPVIPTSLKQATVGDHALIATSHRSTPRAFAKLPVDLIRHRLSMADEQGSLPQSKTISTAPRSVLAVLPDAVSSVRRTTRRISLPRPASYDVDDLLSRCPSLETMAAIRRDFNISFDARIDAPWSCQTDGTESSAMLTVYNAFRAMRLIEFDAPIPVLNATNLYEWLYSLNLSNIHFTYGEMWSYAGRGSISPRGEVLDSPEFRKWIDPRSGIGLVDVVLLIVHESIHANSHGNPNAAADGTIGHPCSNDPSIDNVHDPSIEYGGAWAAQYWTARWFAEHSGHYLTPLEKRYASGAAEQVRSSRFCNGGVR